MMIMTTTKMLMTMMTALCVCSDSRRQYCRRGRQTQDEEIMLCVHVPVAQRINIFKYLTQSGDNTLTATSIKAIIFKNIFDSQKTDL